MEGSSVRGQQKDSIIQLNEAPTIESFQAQIVRIIGSELNHAEVFFDVIDAEPRARQLPVWIRSHLERHPALTKKLQQGEMVGISGSEHAAAPRPAAAVQSNVVLIPILSDARLAAIIGLVSQADQPVPSAEDLESTRQLAYEVSPILHRLQEIQRLRRENEEFAAKAENAAREAEEIVALADNRNALAATLQMRSYQQINLAHELRTPLAAIRGYSRMILDGRSGPITDKQAQYLRVVTDNTNRLIALVSWMSYISALSGQSLKLSTFDFRDLWRECAESNREQLAKKSLRTHEHFADESFGMIGDRERLASALSEVIALAINLAAEGSALNAHLTHGREQELNFKLSETGQEIPADMLKNIFDRPFSGLNNPLAHGGVSEGMSLADLYDAVGLHGGRVFVNSSPGQGATFLFTLPAVSAGGEENSHEQTIHSGRRRR